MNTKNILALALFSWWIAILVVKADPSLEQKTKEVSNLANKYFDSLRNDATQGKAEAQFVLSEIYDMGIGGVEKNYRKSALWLVKAATQRHSKAQARVANHFYYGYHDLIKPDLEAALYHAKCAAAQGEGEAASLLGMIYLKGEDVPKNIDMAETFLELAAVQNIASAQYNLGKLYFNEFGEERWYDAHKWFLAAAKQNLNAAQPALAALYMHPVFEKYDPVKAYAWLLVSLPNTPKEKAEAVAKLWATLAGGLSKEEIEAGKTLALQLEQLILNESQQN